MQLPELTKQYKNDEADFGIDLKKWVMNSLRFPRTTTLEIKSSRGKDNISFRELKQDQIDFALAAKISDKGKWCRISVGTTAAPDYIWLYKTYGYIIIDYPKLFCLIDVETLDMEIKRSKRKSLTVDRAKEIATQVVLHKDINKRP